MSLGFVFGFGAALGGGPRRRRAGVTMAAQKTKAKPALDGKKLVIVESPAKAKTIGKMLPSNEYVVESCVGHVRDLASKKAQVPEKFRSEAWAKLGVNVDQNFEPIYVLKEGKQRVISKLKTLVDSASEVVLATDEDREGEAISWHLLELLKARLRKRGCKVRRAVFHEITPSAIEKAFRDFRDVDMHLVAAQETRRIVDRLAGFTISPVLWKKIARGLSAGRVQSVALDLVVKREMERFEFVTNEYHVLDVELADSEDAKTTFQATLVATKSSDIPGLAPVAQGKDFDGKRKGLSDTALDANVIQLDEKRANDIATRLESANFEVADVTRRKTTRRAPAPYITSTLQQEAYNKLGLTVGLVMRLAQELYEGGLITYMRTDNPTLSKSAEKSAQDLILCTFGQQYVAKPEDTAKVKKPKNAQEAHEAIRPSGEEFHHPSSTGLTGQLLKLYELIYNRTLASQMASAKMDSTTLTVQATTADGEVICVMKATGSILAFAGFLKAYESDTKDPDQSLLPDLRKGDRVFLRKCMTSGHETRPPGRFSEASLVKRLEACGVGRPSTYASIIETLVDREYVTRSSGKALIPTLTAFAVDGLLANHCPSFVDTEFTAKMEQVLDDIAAGKGDRLDYLKGYYWGKDGLVKTADRLEQEVTAADVRRVLLPSLAPLEDRIGVVVGPYGPYVVEHTSGRKNSIPRFTPPDELTPPLIEQILVQSDKPSLGTDPESGKEVLLKLGPYGPYVQLGEDSVVEGSKKNTEPKAKRASLLPGMEPEEVTVQVALSLLSLPRLVGAHPRTQHDIRAGIGRFGPYLLYNDSYISIPADQDVFSIKLEQAVEVISAAETKGKLSRTKELGKIKGTVARIKQGKYGSYVQIGKKNLKLPAATEFDDFTLDMAKELLSASLSKK